MALTVQDDEGTVTDADAYIDVAYADAYFAQYGEPEAWTNATPTEKEIAIRNATRFVDLNFRFFSTRLTDDQNTEFPRDPFLDSANNFVEGIPTLFKDAIAELSAFHLTEDVNTFGGEEKVVSESYGDTSVTYLGSASSAKSGSTVATKWLSRYGAKNASHFRIERG